MNDHHEIQSLNDLLRRELAAVETYREALAHFRRHPVGPILDEMQVGHEDHAARLSQLVRERGGIPVEDTGVWDLFARSVEGTARLFGENSALLALLHGEELGLVAYQEVLQRDGKHPEVAELVRSTVLPRLKRHVSTLRGLTAQR